MHRHWPLLFIIIPLVELYLIIKVGGYIGAFWTVMIVIGTAVIGVNLLRMQGFSTLQRAQQNMAQGAMPAMEMMEGIVLAVGGALLITPGFLTDTLGFICLIPFTRQALIRGFIKRGSVQMHGFQGHEFHHRQYRDHDQAGGSSSQGSGGRTLEGEFHRKDDE
ncbi:MAG: FxsA family protein [Gammaproteobacteria bacterium]|nr:FxsA family protein [Gammaproteobacteria bacterium]